MLDGRTKVFTEPVVMKSADIDTLKIDGTAVTATAAELNYLDKAAAVGVQEASKAVIADANVNTGISKVTELHIGATGAETQVNATAAELNGAADNSYQAAQVEPSTVIAASAASVQTSVVRQDNLITTRIAIDLAGLKSTATNKDVIGDTGVSYIAQITTARNGIIIKGEVSCGEVPTTGDDDIDLYSSTAADGAYDDDASGLAGAAVLMAAAGALAIGTTKPLTALPAPDAYLYLATGDATAGTYDAGKIMIELIGTVA